MLFERHNYIAVEVQLVAGVLITNGHFYIDYILYDDLYRPNVLGQIVDYLRSRGPIRIPYVDLHLISRRANYSLQTGCYSKVSLLSDSLTF